VKTRLPDPRRGPWPFLLAALSGALYFLGFAGFDLWPLCFLALIPLFVVLEGEGAGSDDRPGLGGRRALAVGALFGFVTHAGGYYWLIGMLEEFSGFPLPACIFFAAVVYLYQGGQLALFFWLLARASSRGWPLTPTAVAAYCAVELCYPLLFPSYYCNSLYDLPLLTQVVDLGGPILLTALAIAVNGALYETARALLLKRRFRRALPAVTCAALCFTLAYGWWRIGQVECRVRAAEKISVGVVQTDMGIFQKRSDPLEGHRRHLEQSLQLQREVAPDLLVWPESAVNYVIPEGMRNVRGWLLGPITTPVLFGGISRRTVCGKSRFYNTAFITDAEGDILATYDKTYLLAFGEFLPFGETFPILYEWSPHSGHFSPGEHVKPLPFRDWRLTALICYEDIIPGFVRRAVAEGEPHLLVNITNDSWFGDTNEPWIHLALARFRAVEHHRYLVRATNSGVSAIIDPVGRVVKQSGVFERASLHARVAMLGGRTVYQMLGDWPGWLGLAWTLFAVFRCRPGVSTDRRASPVTAVG
jgi:apolipoprotein N-acyltransferase